MDLSRKAEVTDFHCNGGHSSVNADMMELGAKCPDTLEGGLLYTERFVAQKRLFSLLCWWI